jgi:hypothetical protein
VGGGNEAGAEVLSAADWDCVKAKKREEPPQRHKGTKEHREERKISHPFFVILCASVSLW